MHYFIRRIFWTLFSLSTCCYANCPKENELIPREILFNTSSALSPRVDPLGQNLAFMSGDKEEMRILIAPQGYIEAAYPVACSKSYSIRGYHWTYYPDTLIYSQDQDGDENAQLFIVSTNRSNCSAKLSIPKAISPIGTYSCVTAISPNRPDTIIIQNNQRTLEYFDLYSVNLITQEVSLLLENNQNYTDFVFDSHLQLRFASQVQANGSIMIFEYKNNDFYPYITIPFDNVETTGIIGLSKDNQTLYMTDSRESDKSNIWAIDLKSGVKSLIAASNQVDLSQLILEPHTWHPQAYIEEYLEPETICLDPIFASQWKIASQIAPGKMQILSRSQDDRIWTLAFVRSDSDISYYWFNTLTQNHRFLFRSRPDVARYTLNPMESVIIPARDGLELVSYLTLPHQESLSSRSNTIYPLILIVHGGPADRDCWGYDAEHQWLSNRGFAVLSVNYRGSTGFGQKFLRAGDGEWSQKMHTDLLDAVEWAITQNITDRDMVAIYGGSYGGYATLVGLAMTPQVFRCGIDIVGPANLETLLASVPPYWEPFMYNWRRRFGLACEPSPNDAQVLAAQSPLTFAHQIERPILIAQGANDPRVKQHEADQIVQALEKNNIPYTYLLFPNEGHGFAIPANRKAFYAMAEEFLAKEFGLDYEPIHSEIVNANINIHVKSKN